MNVCEAASKFPVGTRVFGPTPGRYGTVRPFSDYLAQFEGVRAATHNRLAESDHVGTAFTGTSGRSRTLVAVAWDGGPSSRSGMSIGSHYADTLRVEDAPKVYTQREVDSALKDAKAQAYQDGKRAVLAEISATLEKIR